MKLRKFDTGTCTERPFKRTTETIFSEFRMLFTKTMYVFYRVSASVFPFVLKSALSRFHDINVF